MDRVCYIAENADIGIRLDIFAQSKSGNLSRNSVQKLIESGNVTVNNKVAKANYRLVLRDCVEISLPSPVEMQILPEDITLDIVYEDSDVIVVNKAKGMVVHPAPGHYSGTLVNALLFHCRDLSGINGVLRPGIVHRIDKDTSGLLVVTKNDTAHNILAEQFAAHSIKREYMAIVHGGFKEDSGTINKAIARHRVDRKKMSIDPNGRNAVTNYYVTERLGKYTLVKCALETGRTHQIRVHMASIGHPVLGDEVYGNAKQPFAAHTQGQVLHAKTLGFTRPNGEFIDFSSPLPPYFQKVLSLIKN